MGRWGRTCGQCLLGSHPLKDTAHSLVEHLHRDMELVFRGGKEEGDLFTMCRVDRTRHRRLELPPDG